VKKSLKIIFFSFLLVSSTGIYFSQVQTQAQNQPNVSATFTHKPIQNLPAENHDNKDDSSPKPSGKPNPSVDNNAKASTGSGINTDPPSGSERVTGQEPIKKPAKEPAQAATKEPKKQPEKKQEKDPVKAAAKQPETEQKSQSQTLSSIQPEFKIDVSIDEQKVRIYRNGSPVKMFTASTGLNNSTPLGNFTIQNRGEWFFSDKYQEGAEYWVSFKDWGVYLFHTVPMDEEKAIIPDEADKMGLPASHGCIRLEIESAKWIYDHIPQGTPVYIH
jgi:lipoprotein-anchoring transpeptidase ErfK/SrfK